MSQLKKSYMFVHSYEKPSFTPTQCGCIFISNFCLVLYVVCFLLYNSPASEFYMPTFRNTLFHLHRQVRK
jgi:hypothetical protein